MIIHLFLFYGHRCSHFVMLSVCPHITSLTNGLSRVAELGQESRASIWRGQSTSAPFKWSVLDYEFVNPWVGNQRGSTSTADQGGGFASECSQGLSKVDSPCWVKSKDNMTDLKFQVCFLTFSRISFPFPMTHLTLFPYEPQIWFWSPWLVCSDLIVTGISELILVSDVSRKKTIYPPIQHVIAPDSPYSCVYFHAQITNRYLPKHLTVFCPQRIHSAMLRRISAMSGVCFKIFCFLTRKSETGCLGGSHSEIFCILVEMQLEASKLNFLLLS